MERMKLAALAEYFADEGDHHELAGTISDIQRNPGDECCPFCLGTDGRKTMLKSIGLPKGEVNKSEDYFKCPACYTTYGVGQSLWRVV
ncbi:MAG: hypothetical protein K8F90_20590 [Hyphomicrobiales bacterium]|nr:hypothetical protein [Hyphomicrobiales bacterium]